MEFHRPARILPFIVFSQFTGTSLWFAGNAVLPDIQAIYNYGDAALSLLTSSVQLGFIAGTLLFAFFNISDRFSPIKVFLICSLAGSASTLFIIPWIDQLEIVLFFRFATGFFLAGIYPVGMKIAAGWYPKGLGKALGFLVGALVLGTAFPHLLRSIGSVISWQMVLQIVASLAALGGLLMIWQVPNGPFAKHGAKFDPVALYRIFKVPEFRKAAFGYFGHMWELYAYWAFIPLILETYRAYHQVDLNISLWSFFIVASGFLGCSLGGLISLRTGSAKVAFVNLGISGICCLLSPLFFFTPLPVFLLFLLIWGTTVVGDSPQFSSLSAQTCPKDFVGTGLTIVNSIGFGITIFSIQLIGFLTTFLSPEYWMIILVIGPIFGLISIFPLTKKEAYT